MRGGDADSDCVAGTDSECVAAGTDSDSRLGVVGCSVRSVPTSCTSRGSAPRPSIDSNLPPRHDPWLLFCAPQSTTCSHVLPTMLIELLSGEPLLLLQLSAHQLIGAHFSFRRGGATFPRHQSRRWRTLEHCHATAAEPRHYPSIDATAMPCHRGRTAAEPPPWMTREDN